MKPAARAQGKGIFLFRKLQDITAWRKVRLVYFVFLIYLFDLGRVYDSL
jgi:hypothetical protein